MGKLSVWFYYSIMRIVWYIKLLSTSFLILDDIVGELLVIHKENYFTL